MAALVPVGGSGDMQGCLLQLHGALRDPDPGSAALRGFNLVRSVGEACVTRTGDSAQGACGSAGRAGGRARGVPGRRRQQSFAVLSVCAAAGCGQTGL